MTLCGTYSANIMVTSNRMEKVEIYLFIEWGHMDVWGAYRHSFGRG